jgi:hypothetical protein
MGAGARAIVVENSFIRQENKKLKKYFENTPKVRVLALSVEIELLYTYIFDRGSIPLKRKEPSRS